MSRRKPTKESRSIPDEDKNKEPENKTQLQKKLKEKLQTSQLCRKSRFARENRIDKLEDKLETSKNPTERRNLKKQIDILEKVVEKEEDFPGEYPEYDV